MGARWPPLFYHLYAHSETSTLWMTNLEAGGYNPYPFLKGSVAILIAEALANWLWYSRFDNSVKPQLEK